jgi:protein-disulfide isomerase/uncharacterized membrane protein
LNAGQVAEEQGVANGMCEPTKHDSRSFWIALAFALTLLGGAASAYLLVRHFTAYSNGNHLFDICRAVFNADCDAAMRSPFAMQLGAPLAGWGLIHFVMVAFSLTLANALGESFRSHAMLVALVLCIVAAVLGCILTAMMFTGATAFCPLCVVIHGINLLLVPIVQQGSGRTAGELLGSVASGGKYLLGGEVQDPVAARWKVVGFVTIALAGIVVYQWVLIQTDRRADDLDAAMSFERVLAEFKAGDAQEILVGDDDPWLGDRKSPVRLVVFSDFECPACRRFAASLMHVRERYPQVAVVFKHYPLSSQCNALIHRDLHPLSCAAAYAADAARQQGKFWEYHDALFAASRELNDDELHELARGIGLDMDRFEADLADEATNAKVAADVAVGNQLDVNGTPTAFLNGKELSGRAMSHLEELIEHQLKQ